MDLRRLGALALLAGTLTGTLPGQQMVTSADSARHALLRLAWGPTPGQVEAVARGGVMHWIDAQLAVPALADPAAASRERGLNSLTTPTTELITVEAELRRQAAQARADSGGRPAGLRPPADGAMARPRNPLREVLGEYAALTLRREVDSPNQLGEVLADFWFNHFNVHQNKGLDRVFLRDYVEQVIRPRALGTFADLLIATAQSPAMLFYLDNAQSIADGADPRDAIRGRLPAAARRRAANRSADPRVEQLMARMPKGINENYARELLELHTLGVDGGYTQADVIAVARILTGWSLDRRTGRFTFNAWAHDRGEKTVLGLHFAAGGGEEEGVRLLRMLAAHPATMHHVSAQLCTRLVADVPPDGCIDDAVRAWHRSGGDIRQVVAAIVHGPDFWAAANRGAKMKSPQEFLVSAVRALGGESDLSPALVGRLAQLGQPLFQQSAPTGWPETQEDWVSSSALLARMNLGVALAAGRVPGVRSDLDRIVPASADHAALVDAIDRDVLGGAMSANTRQVILAEIADLADPRAARAMAIGLALGGPDFQRQ